MSVSSMLSQLSWNEFVEWIVFAELEPFDETRADIRTAAIRSTIANVNRKRGTRPYTLKDFALRFGDYAPEKQTQSWQQMKMIGKMMALSSSEEKGPKPRAGVKNVRQRRRTDR